MADMERAKNAESGRKSPSLRRFSADEKAFLRLLGIRIGDLRHERGLSAKQCAEACKIVRSMQHYIETGKTAASIVVIRRIADVLGLTVGELVDNLQPRSTVEKRQVRKKSATPK